MGHLSPLQGEIRYAPLPAFSYSPSFSLSVSVFTSPFIPLHPSLSIYSLLTTLQEAGANVVQQMRDASPSSANARLEFKKLDITCMAEIKQFARECIPPFSHSLFLPPFPPPLNIFYSVKIPKHMLMRPWMY